MINKSCLQNLRVSENHRFLVQEDGKPFFYLGDTAWELFHRLNRVEAERYFNNRAQKGFNVVQAAILGELDGLHDLQVCQHAPLKNDDPTQPNELYFEHVDWMVNKANELGIYIGMLPTWGDKWNIQNGIGPEIFTPENARKYGSWLGRRYRYSAVIWILGGDRPVETEAHRAIISEMAAGLREGDGGLHLITFHPPNGDQSGSTNFFPDEPWLDFHMRQNGHAGNFFVYDRTHADYNRTPVKPVIDGEPLYEDHPINFRAGENGFSVAADVRRALYWNVFRGAFGHTYGHHSVWQMAAPHLKPLRSYLMPWHEALDQPGASQMQHGRRLMESRPFLTRIPDDSIIVQHKIPAAIPGAGERRFVATCDIDGTYAMAYFPISRECRVRMNCIKGSKVTAWWFNPRTGTPSRIGEFSNTGEQEFCPPDKGELLDWVLVLDDATQQYPPPGRSIQ